MEACGRHAALSVRAAAGRLPRGRKNANAGGVNGAAASAKSPVGKESALASVLAEIDASFGKGSIMRLGSEEDAMGIGVETFGTGAVTLDRALGGGLPRGRIVEIYGPESIGKTTLAMHAIAEVQKRGEVAAT